MEPNLICPHCSTTTPATSFFCPNCGKQLRHKPLSMSFGAQTKIYLLSVCFPPSGFWYGYKYLREKNTKANIIGVVAILLTIGILIVTTISIIGFANEINKAYSSALSPQLSPTNTSKLQQQLNQQLDQYKNLGL